MTVTPKSMRLGELSLRKKKVKTEPRTKLQRRSSFEGVGRKRNPQRKLRRNVRGLRELRRAFQEAGRGQQCQTMLKFSNVNLYYEGPNGLKEKGSLLETRDSEWEGVA